MKDNIAKIIFIIFDVIIITFSIYLSYIIRGEFEHLGYNSVPLGQYFDFYPLLLVPILLFAYEGIYTYRYDFWHESRLIIKGIIFSTIIIFAYLAMTKMIIDYSRFVIGIAFLIMMILIPLSKNISKKILYKLGLWQKKAKIYGNDPFLKDEIYGNPYLGYVKPNAHEKHSTVFVNSKESDIATLRKVISSEIKAERRLFLFRLWMIMTSRIRIFMISPIRVQI